MPKTAKKKAKARKDVKLAERKTTAEPEKMTETKKMAPATARPAGVTIICALVFILSILLIIAGVFFIAFANYASEFAGTELAGASPAVFVALGALSIIIGIVGILAFYLLLKMKKAGWLIVTVVGIVAIVSGIVSVAGGSYTSIGSIALWIIIIGYLWTKRALFA